MQRMKFDTEYGVDKYLIVDSDEIVAAAERPAMNGRLERKLGRGRQEWYDNCSYDKFSQSIRTGDESLVQEAEEFLREIEDQVPVSRGWRNVDDVIGAVPNVPSFLAGHPQCMRRRERTWKESAPLAIYLDLTSSAGISARQLRRRGVVMLALVRLLVEHRPVTLYAGTSQGNYRLSGTTMWQIDTAPLDLARAAFMIGSPAMARGFGYESNYEYHRTSGAWPFNDYSISASTGKARLEAVFPGQETMYVPAIFATDPMKADPVGWLKRAIKKYTRSEEEE